MRCRRCSQLNPRGLKQCRQCGASLGRERGRGNRLLLPLLGAGLLVVIAAAGVYWWRSPFAPRDVRPSAHARNVLFITLDTTRADRLGCYGHVDAKTPTLDSLAKNGTLFERAYCQVPLTLPSHGSIFTGRYPREIGLRLDGTGTLSAEHETLANVAGTAGLKTAAFVGSFMLDERFGLARGFAHYDDELLRPGIDVEPAAVERRGDAVTDRALAWLKTNASGNDPFFCWVHYRDPHAPHEPPPEVRANAKTPYDGEVTFVDGQIKRLLDGLDQANRSDDTLIVVAGTNGESFGEHGEHGHEMLLHETNLRVPLIFAFRGVVGAGQRISGPIELTSVFPTVCDLMDWRIPAAVTNPPLTAAILGRPDVARPACFAESNEAFHAHRWAEQRALIDGRWKYISSSKPELYDLSSDPAERMNVSAANSEVAAEMDRKLRERYARMRPASDDTPRSGDEFLTAGAPDPKDMADALEAFRPVARMLREEKYADAIARLESITSRSPNSPRFLQLLGSTCVLSGDFERAIAVLSQSLELDPHNARTLLSLGDALMQKPDVQGAADRYTAAAEADPTDPEVHLRLGGAKRLLGQLDAARTAYERALTLYPEFLDAAMELIALAQTQEKVPEVLQFLQKMDEEHPGSARTVFYIGVALSATGKYEEAIARFQEVLKRDRSYGHAYNKLGICAARLGRYTDATTYFESAKSYDESRPEAWFNEGVSLAKQGKIAEAIAAYEQALVVKPAYPGAIAAVTFLYAQVRDAKGALRVLRAGVQSCPNDARIHASLADLLSTCADPAVRNGAEALRHARRAIELMRGAEHPGVIAILATSLAETGDFAGAKQNASRAKQLAEQLGDAALARSIAAQLAAFERGEAYRAPGSAAP